MNRFILFLLCSAISASAVTDNDLKQVAFDQKLGTQISLDLSFRDEDGKPVKLADYFGKKPVILDLGYYKCPMLCTAVLNGMMLGLQRHGFANRARL